MSTYKAPLDDLRFALYDVLGAEGAVCPTGPGRRQPRTGRCRAGRSRALRRNRAGTAQQGRRRDRLQPTTRPPATSPPPPGFKQAFDQFVEGGWTGLTNAPEHGGQGMPAVVGAA
jgi:alkylation response protein AidB-like acyl-CoA dehydrogenase